MNKKIWSLLVFLIFISTCLSFATAPDYINPNKQNQIDDTGSNIVIKVVFNSIPAYAKSHFTNLKFGKAAVLNFEWDDNTTDCLTGLAIFNGGLATNGITYPGKTFTDGCGNKINYRSALAVNTLSDYNGEELGLKYPGKVSYQQMKGLINQGWDIENHSSKHADQKSLTSAKADLTKANQLIFDRTAYNMNTLVVPTNYNFYMKAAEELGFLAGTTQADDAKDGLIIYPSNAWKNNVDFMKIPYGFTALNRLFNDDWSNTDDLKSRIEETMQTSTSSVNKLIRIGTHNTSSIAGFASFINDINKIAQDRLWVTSMRELCEYRETKHQTRKTEVLKDNALTITLNQKDIPAMIRWRDLSMMVSSNASIKTIIINGADHSSYNLKTGLINIFKENKSFKTASLF